MSVTYSYSGATYNVGRLSNELVAGGVTVETVRGDTAAIDVVCADGTVQATVDAIVAAHVGTASPMGSPTGAWPVGSVFIAVVSTNPATLLGYGTWSAFGAGRVLVGLDSGDVNFDTVEETGGAKTVAAAGTNSAPTFTGSPTNASSANLSVNLFAEDTSASGKTPSTTAQGTVSAPTFTGSATSVVQPYIVVYMWKRTA